jgi:hypothetical protein
MLLGEFMHLPLDFSATPSAWLTLLGSLIGFFLVGWGAWTVIQWIYRSIVVRAGARQGIIAQGNVWKVELIDSKIPLCRIHYQYCDMHGKAYLGISPPMDELEADTWRVGDLATIRYRPKHPKQHIWIGRAIARSEKVLKELRQRPYDEVMDIIEHLPHARRKSVVQKLRAVLRSPL